MRLTNKIREQALNSALEALFKKRADALDEQARDLAQEACERMYPKKVRDWLASAPSSECYDTWSSVTILVNGRDMPHPAYHRLQHPRTGYRKDRIQLSKPVRVVAADRFEKDVALQGKLAERLLYLLTDFELLQGEYKAAKETLTSALRACNTRKQLEERYPDLVRFLPKPEPSKGQAITITNDDIRRVLSLAKRRKI